MSLQRRHLKNKMMRGSEKLMNYDEFHILINEAVKFLKVEFPKEITNSIFNKTDKDNDSHITYVEYFQAVSSYICKSKAGNILLTQSSKSSKKLSSLHPSHNLLLKFLKS